MRKNNTSKKAPEAAACGIDLGSRYSEICVLDAEGEVLERDRLKTTPEALEQAFAAKPSLRIAIETGGQSNWVRRLLSEWGHQVIVADAKRVKLITDTHSKDDRRDARWLAQILLRWPELLKPVAPRSLESEQHRALLKARECLVQARVKLILCVRGILGGFGQRLPEMTSEAFARKTALLVPEPLREALQPAIEAVAALSVEIRRYDRQVEQLCRTRYRAATKRMRSIQGRGAADGAGLHLGTRRQCRAAALFAGRRGFGRTAAQAPRIGSTTAGAVDHQDRQPHAAQAAGAVRPLHSQPRPRQLPAALGPGAGAAQRNQARQTPRRHRGRPQAGRAAACALAQRRRLRSVARRARRGNDFIASAEDFC